MRVPNLKMKLETGRFRYLQVGFRYIMAQRACPRTLVLSGTPQAPADHRRLDWPAGFIVAPFAVDPTARERQLIGAAVILA